MSDIEFELHQDMVNGLNRISIDNKSSLAPFCNSLGHEILRLKK